jgi:hypothetical protein
MKWVPSLCSFFTALALATAPAAQAYISHHPLLSLAVGTVATISAHLLPSPLAK